MARQTAEKKRAAKDAKQKKLLFVLVPVFLLLLVWQGPSYLTMITGGGEEAAPAQAPTATTATPPATTPADPGAAPPSTSAGANGAGTETAAAPETLPESDAPAVAGSDQLVTFDLFSAKNPFEQQVDDEEAPASGGATGGGSKTSDGSGGSSSGSFDGSGSGSGSGSGTNSGTGSGGSGTGSGGSGGSGSGSGTGSGGSGGSKTTTAALTVNGTAERVAAGGAFPASDPVFRVESIGSSSVEVGLVSGSFSDGSETMKLSVGKTLTLVSQPDGLRYTIKLVSLS